MYKKSYNIRHLKKNKKIIKLVLLLLILVLFGYFLNGNDKVNIDQNLIKDTVKLNYDTMYNYRMKGNHCGPYSVAAVYRILKYEDIDSQTLYLESDYKVGRRGNLPWGIENLLGKYGINYKVYDLEDKSNEYKISFLQQELSLGRPVIILGGWNGGGPKQHYLTILGFDRQQELFYIYDSWYIAGEDGLTSDGNGELPGNRNFSSDELLEFRGGGGMYGVYKWYSVSCYL